MLSQKSDVRPATADSDEVPQGPDTNGGQVVVWRMEAAVPEG